MIAVICIACVVVNTSFKSRGFYIETESNVLHWGLTASVIGYKYSQYFGDKRSIYLCIYLVPMHLFPCTYIFTCLHLTIHTHKRARTFYWFIFACTSWITHATGSPL